MDLPKRTDLLCRSDIKFSQTATNYQAKLSDDCVNVSCVNMFTNKTDKFVSGKRQLRNR